jgi:hypothetical protein
MKRDMGYENREGFLREVENKITKIKIILKKYFFENKNVILV